MAKQHSPAFVRLVDEAKSRISEMTPSELRERQEANPALHLVDVREDREYEKSHVEGAHHLGKGIIERDIETAIPDRDAEVVLYCGGGYRSALAADSLQQMGYQNVYSLDGGFRALQSEGFTIEEEEGA
ncbi:MAG: rhodanese-like domain-containing protein [Rhodothermales bacterium]